MWRRVICFLQRFANISPRTTRVTGPIPGRSDIERFSDGLELSGRDVSHYETTRPTSLRESHEHLLAAYEELSVAEEQLRAQHETIIEAQRLLEVQRNRYR